MIRRTFLVGAAVFGSLRSDAHKLQYSLTDLNWRADAGTLEIVHSIHLDDAMSLLARLGAPGGDLDVATEARVMFYIEKHFKLSQSAEELAPEAVGAQIAGDYLWIYQELALPKYPASLQVECTVLHELFPAQQNQVNLRIGDYVRTLRFDAMHNVDTFSAANSAD